MHFMLKDATSDLEFNWLCQVVTNTSWPKLVTSWVMSQLSSNGLSVKALDAHTSLEVNRLKLHSDRSIYDFVKYLKDKALHLNRHDLEEVETAIGFSPWPEGLLQDESLDIAPISSTAFDPMHVYLVAGLFHIEATLLLEKLGHAGVRRTASDKFLQDITWPAVVQSSGTSGKSAFAKKVQDTFKCTAGEPLALYPTLRLFLSVAPVNNAITRPAIKSFYSLCAVLDSATQQMGRSHSHHRL